MLDVSIFSAPSNRQDIFADSAAYYFGSANGPNRSCSTASPVDT